METRRGDRFGHLVACFPVRHTPHGIVWAMKCDCGKFTEHTGGSVRYSVAQGLNVACTTCMGGSYTRRWHGKYQAIGEETSVHLAWNAVARGTNYHGPGAGSWRLDLLAEEDVCESDIRDELDLLEWPGLDDVLRVAPVVDLNFYTVGETLRVKNLVESP